MFIRKFNTGGMPFSLYTPVAPWTSTPQNPSPAVLEKDSDEKESGSKLIDDAIKAALKLAMEAGALPNEMDSLLGDFLNFLKNPTNWNYAKLILRKANIVAYNAKYMNNVTTLMNENEAAGEIARYGTRIYCLDEKGNLKLLSVDEYNKNRTKYAPITYSELNTMRRYDDDLKFNASVFSAINSGIGLTKINDFIKGIIDKIGTETEKYTRNTSKLDTYTLIQALTEVLTKNSEAGHLPTKEQKLALNDLVEAYKSMGEEGIYKVSYEHSSERNHMNSVFTYLYQMLPTNMKNAVEVESKLNGTNPSEVIFNMLVAGTNETNSVIADYDASANKDKTEKESASGKIRLNPTEKLINGDLNSTYYEVRSAVDSSYNLKFPASLSGILPDLNNNPIKAQPLSGVLEPLNFGAFVDLNHMFFGSHKINANEINKILYTGSKSMNVKMPITSSGDIDWAKASQFGMAGKEIDQLAEKKPELILEIFNKYLIPATVHLDGSITYAFKMGDFIAILGESTDHIMDFDDPYIEELQGVDLEARKEADYKLWEEADLDDDMDGYWGIGLSDIVRGTVFMKLLPSASTDASYLTGHGSLVQNPTLEEDLVHENMKKSREQNSFNNQNLNISALNK